MSELLATSLPDLITKFHSSSEQVVWLAEIVENLDLSVYSEKRLDSWFKKLLEALDKLFFDFDRFGQGQRGSNQ